MQRRLSDVPVIVDENGDVAVSSGKLGVSGQTGSATIDFAVLEENGNTRFRYTYGEGGSVFDKKGNIYLASGLIQSSPFTPDIVAKLDRWGRNIWSGTTIAQEPPGWTTNGAPNYITLDASGDVLLCGRPWEDPSDIWKIDGRTGELLWSRFTEMTISNGLRQVATDSENNVIVVGAAQNQPNHFLLMKYDPSGQLIFGHTGLPPVIFNVPPPTPFYPESVSCCVDPDDNIYISVRFTLSGLDPSVIGIKYDKHGNELFKINVPAQFREDFPGVNPFNGGGMACDHIGNLYMTFGPNANTRGMFSNDPDGNIRWESELYGSEPIPKYLTTDSTGNLFVPLGFRRLAYVNGLTGVILNEYPLPGFFPEVVDRVSVSRPEALIGPVLQGRSNLFDSGHYLDYNIPAVDPPYVGSTGDEIQEPGDINSPDDSEKNITAGTFRAIRDLDSVSFPQDDEFNNTDNFDKMSSSIVSPAPVWFSLNTYKVDNKVFHDSVFYNCITDHSTNIEPGVHGDWETYWEVIASPDQPFNSIAGYGGKGFNDPQDPETTTPQWYTAAFHGIETSGGESHTLNGVYQCAKLHGGNDSQWRHLRYHPPQSSVNVNFTLGQDTTKISLSTDTNEIPWVSGASYSAGSSRVIHRGTIFSCIQTHNNPPKEPGVSSDWAEYWKTSPATQVLVFDFTVTGGMGALLRLSAVANEIDAAAVGGIASVYPGVIDQWDPPVDYIQGDQVAWQGKFYIANIPNTGQIPGLSSLWDRVV